MQAWILPLLLLLLTASPGHACSGDCNDDGAVTIAELIVAVRIALGTAEVATCAPLDLDGDGTAVIAELIAAVNAALDSCGTCVIGPGAPGAAAATRRIAAGLALPVHVAGPPGDPRRLMIVEQRGRIRLLRDGALAAEPFLDIANQVSCCIERGLLSIAFHPDYAANGRFFVNYTNRSGDTVISRFETLDADRAERASERVLLTIDQPFPNHNGGQLAFGPDGYLYAGMGDGGAGGDPMDNAQSDTSLLGKLLRLDVDVESAPYYAVPPDNPNPGRGEPLGLIWAKGLRNPWRFSFDRGTGDLYIGDVGQSEREEIDVQPAASQGGENYGWDTFEAELCYEPEGPSCPAPDGFVFPVVSYGRTDGCSVTGGFVYRGCTLPDLRGRYFYSDYCTAFLRTFLYAGTAATEQRDLTDALRPDAGTIDSVTSFGEDTHGELYVADHDGEIFKLVPRAE